MAFGSPHHLAPEQCRAEAVTPETDVWAGAWCSSKRSREPFPSTVRRPSR
jgi:hypothetical protein